MTNTTAVAAQRGVQLDEDCVIWAVPAGLLVILLVALFLPDRVAADTVVRAFVLLLILMSLSDLLTLKIPNILVYPAIGFSIATTAILDFDSMLSAMLGGLVVLGIMIALALVQRGAMGMGDVKIACFGGCILGIKGGVFSLLFGFSIAGLVALPLLLLRLRGRRDVLPLGPFLALGILVSAFFWGFLIDGELGILI